MAERDGAGELEPARERADAGARNRALSNLGEGILLRNAQGGRVERNRLEGNCSGLIVLAGAPGPAGRFRIARKRVISNNRFCAGEPAEGEPPVSGIGIALAGAFRTEVVRNVVLRNRPSRRCNGRCVFPGGIVVVRFGRFRPARDLVAFNTALSNVPVDLRWDRSGTVGFTRNRCRTSRPRGLCPQPGRKPRPKPRPRPRPQPRRSCDRSYPTVCIPPPPPDLDCGDVCVRRFRVVGSDPHRFDSDRDGVGCES